MALVFTAIRALFFMSAFVSFWAWLAILIHRKYNASLGVDLPAWVEPAGLVMVVVGGGLALSCVGVFFVIGRGTPAPFDAPRRFVAVGPYRFVRNPMYIGAFLAMWGFGSFMDSAVVLLFGIPWILTAHAFVLWYEEPALKERFGMEYKEYCRRVNRWIPRYRRRSL